ncbi:alkaline phosphatase family protein [Arthrobacter sp. TES]|uniref:alkaline phosphatase family protein n=1 Tax=Paenarthrobacter TaxID=1742992 RepID=UPI0005A4BF1E|nr:nucleotide pyrophosphatase/phosphodiesterase family protein [Paenarthrobacter ureafaciens]ERI36985.2 phosphodiesterase [Arthrobacter sp. AK-YN10]NKR12906.1 phosphodiesterase [Arthrobacter sp. M5]NKR15366.1 phosphodiesterase [Arthrobacter sp. M6]OEH59551.1 phosphodiesterase [Arthrobacter sp. D2]OEH60640.1 phosphodiesterase [Arthrobacter sp. D4]QOI63551.1 alkaline phosphatase family protein [Arthrobacter sp. TES]
MSVAAQPDPLAAPDLPSPPLFGSKSIAEVFTSAAASLGLPGFSNHLKLPAADRVCVVLADGLGRGLLKQKASHTPFLRSVVAAGQGSVPTWIDAAFPSTTAASLASLGTGRPAGHHGMVGYDVLDPAQDKVVNLLGNWDALVDPAVWQPHRTVFEQVANEVDVVTVSLPQFGNSPMTQAALRGSRFVGGTTLHARTASAGEAMAGSPRSLMYFYVNELDKAGHRYGCQSARWEHQLEELDATVKRLSASLPAGTTIVVTGDHGMLDVPESQRLDYSAEPALVAGVRHTAGEPRMVHLYLEPDAGNTVKEELIAAWRKRFGERVWVFTREQAIAAGLFGEVQAQVAPRIGDVMIAARDTLALYDARRVRPAAMEVVGQHGSLTKAEREVPFLCFTATGRKGARG